VSPFSHSVGKSKLSLFMSKHQPLIDDCGSVLVSSI
jgi:hypothetical protein